VEPLHDFTQTDILDEQHAHNLKPGLIPERLMKEGQLFQLLILSQDGIDFFSRSDDFLNFFTDRQMPWLELMVCDTRPLLPQTIIQLYF
jgi:hypothetical protein